MLNTTTKQSPLAHVILRPYRKEVCAQCFSYDRGREWKIRDVATGTAFCSSQCQKTWALDHDSLTLEACIAVEAFAKSLLKRKCADDDELGNDNPQYKTEADAIQHTQAVWRDADIAADELRQARRTSKLTKPNRAALNKAKDLTPDPDILSYALSGSLAAYMSQKLSSTPEQTCAQILLPSLFALAEDRTVFLHTPTTISPLSDYTSSYLVLLAILPRPFLELITADLIINLASRASHNAFSIRPEGNTDGDQSGEFLGWGVWPEASFFNHSCQPNVRKERRGRIWSFSVGSSTSDSVVEINGQLCITYLGGDERDLDVNERRQKLLTQWGFWCQCDRCVQESGHYIEETA